MLTEAAPVAAMGDYQTESDRLYAKKDAENLHVFYHEKGMNPAMTMLQAVMELRWI